MSLPAIYNLPGFLYGSVKELPIGIWVVQYSDNYNKSLANARIKIGDTKGKFAGYQLQDIESGLKGGYLQRHDSFPRKGDFVAHLIEVIGSLIGFASTFEEDDVLFDTLLQLMRQETELDFHKLEYREDLKI
ncbi:hypothetical protein A3K63_04235 [Candidatus Micrarchaeota archaeon RBG_16_49_10]|nr:MAG: hypothetical protein A3K63_04235 [Candidatus Micrarchaeota archaeon RBG_16_49_10]